MPECICDIPVAFFVTDISSSECEEDPLQLLITSSSEEEFEEVETTCTENTFVDGRDPHVGIFIQWIVIFLGLWQSAFSISDTAMRVLLKFLVTLLKALVEKSTLAVLTLLSSAMPTSIYKLRKYVMSRCQNSCVEYVVCPTCFTLYKEEECLTRSNLSNEEIIPKTCSHVKFPNHPMLHHRKSCGSPLMKKIHLSNGKVEYRPRFVYAYQPIKTSLQQLLNRPGFAAKLEHWRTRPAVDSKLSDVYDGNVWKDFCSDKYNKFLTYKRNYGVMLNMDFFQPYKHTTDSYGALYLTLMNLPRSERFKQQNVLLVGVIPPFEHEPSSLNSFLKPIVDELKEFWQPGVRLNTFESPKYKLLFKVALMCVACDIPAARKCCGFKGHSANHGCSRCKKFFPGAIGAKDYSGFDRSQWPPRKYEAHMEATKKITECNTQSSLGRLETETGVKYSILTKLPYFDPIRFTIIDPMHNLFLGTAKHVMKKIWLGKSISDAKLDTIQCRIDSMRVPSDMGRIPKKIASNFSGFTAEQLKNWTVVYSMYALRGLISQDEYYCWQAFVLACYLVCRRTIERQDIDKADLLFVKFCRHVERLYGAAVITPNMHLHCHLGDCMKDYGTVYGFWCFSYERYNGILGSFPTNKKCVASQLMRRFIYESQCLSLHLPDDLASTFKDTLPTVLISDPSEIHRHLTPTILSNCFELAQIHLSSFFKTAILCSSDVDSLKSVYKHMYGDLEGFVFTRTIKIIKSVRIYGQQFGSLRDPRTKNSSFLMATWSKEDGTIYSEIDSISNRVTRPGKVLYFMLNKVQIGSEYREHLFAVVGWLKEHHCRLMYGKPMEIWDDSQCIQDGPGTFLPIDKIKCRFVAGFGRVVMPSGNEDKVMFVCPIPTLGYF